MATTGATCSTGYYATRALRIEKFYAFWGQDLDTFTTPLECGRSWRVKFNVSWEQGITIRRAFNIAGISYYATETH